MSDNRRDLPGNSCGLGGIDGDGSLFNEANAIVDDLRQIAVDLGQNPYRVFSVVVRWTGGARGRGDQVLVSESELVPTPQVDYRPLRQELANAGSLERGTVRLTHVSPRYSEPEIRALLFRDLVDGEEAYIESRIDGRNDGDPQRRRFVVSGAPWLDQKRFQWVVPMTEQDDRRAASGGIPRPSETW